MVIRNALKNINRSKKLKKKGLLTLTELLNIQSLSNTSPISLIRLQQDLKKTRVAT